MQHARILRLASWIGLAGRKFHGIHLSRNRILLLESDLALRILTRILFCNVSTSPLEKGLNESYLASLYLFHEALDNGLHEPQGFQGPRTSLSCYIATAKIDEAYS